MPRNFPRNVWAFVLWVRKKSRKIPSKFPTKFYKFPCEKSKKIHRRASAAAQGEHHLMVSSLKCNDFEKREREREREREKVLVFFRVWTFNAHALDIFETPTGPPDPRSPKTPQQQKKKFQKPRKPRLSPKVDARSPKVDARSPKVDARSPKVNVKYF